MGMTFKQILFLFIKSCKRGNRNIDLNENFLGNLALALGDTL
jgi:hypothetical protein